MRTFNYASRFYALIFVTCLVVVSFRTTAFGQEVDTTSITQGTSAEPLERIPPKYPPRAARRDQEGWVLVNYVIQTDGSVTDVAIEDTSGVRDFERAAIKAISKWRFKPATLNGVPVEQCNTQQKITFEFEKFLGARNSYIRKAKAANRLIENKKFEEAQSAVDAIFAEGELNLYETARLWLIQFEIDQLRGDDRKSFASLKRAWAGDGHNIEENMHDDVLAGLFVFQLRYNFYADALWTFEKLKKVRNGLKGREPLSQAAKDLFDMVHNPQPIGIDGVVENRCNCETGTPIWTYQLLRREFKFEDIVGEMDHIELWCDYHKAADSFYLDRTWQIPESWGQCRLQVHGEEGTTFTLVEYSS